MRMRSLLRGRSLFMIFALCVVAIVWLLLDKDESGAVQWLTQQPKAQGSRLAFLGKWAQPIKSQVLRFKFWLVGPPQMITVQGDVLKLESPAVLSNLLASSTLFSNSIGRQAWLLPYAPSVNSMTNDGVEVVTRTSVLMINGMQSQVSVTERVLIGERWENIGVRVDFWPHRRGQAVELTSFLLATEKVAGNESSGTGTSSTNSSFLRTNASFGARVRVPQGASVFLLATDTVDEKGKLTGVLLSPRLVPRAKR